MNDEDALLLELKQVLDRAEPTPSPSTAMAEAALGVRTIDAELAMLVHDSAIDQDALLVRGDHERNRVLEFTAGDVSISVDYADGRLVGQVIPASPTGVEVMREGDEQGASVQTDEFGAFVITDISPGLVSIVCRALDGSWSIRTPHVLL